MDWALTDFSGYLAADELHDGPYCVLSLVDNHSFKRLAYQVLARGQKPTRARVTVFFRRFQAVLRARGLRLAGITTDGSDLYPPAIAAAFGPVPHQVCEFHVLKRILLAFHHAVAQRRRGLKSQKPPWPRGRPALHDRAAQRCVRQRLRLQQKITDLFTQRHLFVKRHLTRAQRQRLLTITRGLPHLRRLRALMEAVYHLFDRRCRTQTALAKLARLRRRAQRFQDLGQCLQVLYSPLLARALTYLDDPQLPATSNAVERSYRRHRKMQNSIYCVRTRAHLIGRIALDMCRDAQAPSRHTTIALLHQARAVSVPMPDPPFPVGML